jgi:hypothetical protein
MGRFDGARSPIPPMLKLIFFLPMKTLSLLILTATFLFGTTDCLASSQRPDRSSGPSHYQAENRTAENYIRVFGNSMNPALSHNQILEVDYNFPFHKLKHGDVVLFSCDRGIQVVHRIRERVEFGRWVTKGDNNPVDDSTILSPKNFLGKISLIES